MQSFQILRSLADLHGSGNAATLLHYADLLEMAFLIRRLNGFTTQSHRTKKSIPKWILLNPALVEAEQRRKGPVGFVFENIVGAHLCNLSMGRPQYDLRYWRLRNKEIDFIVLKNEAL